MSTSRAIAPLPRALIARPLVEWYEGEAEGLVVLKHPRFRRGPLARLVQKVLESPTVKIKLDDVGSFVWLRCLEGQRVGEIQDAMHEHFGERVEPPAERLALFLGELARRGFVQLLQPPAAAVEGE